MSDIAKGSQEGEPQELRSQTKLPAFRTMALGYKFVFVNWRTFIRMGWRDFLGAIGLVAASALIDAALFGMDGPRGFIYVLIPLAGWFVLRFAVKCHRYFLLLEERPDTDEARERAGDAMRAYMALFLICAIVLAAPILGIVALTFWLDLPEIFLMPLGVAAVVLDFYLVARMSVLFPMAAVLGYLPPRWTWAISKGFVWKLLIIVLLAPWPFNLVLELIDRIDDGLPQVLQLASFVLSAAIFFAGVAVLTTILSQAQQLCLAYNKATLARLAPEEAS
jgi:hypothetical protein